MAWNDLKQSLSDLLLPRQEPAGLVSRRDALAGLGLAGLVAFAGPALLIPDQAQAQPRYRRGRGGRGRYYSRSELRRRCRSRRFRYRNPGLCRRAWGRGRRGTCVWVGPVRICD